MQDGLFAVIETLPPELQAPKVSIGVYEYALSLRGRLETENTQPLILNMHKGALTIDEDSDAPLPDAFWLGER